MKRHYNIIVTGKVQGVFYRVNAKEAADKYNVKGFVQNEKDGSVYIEAEGEEEDLKQFVAWCKKGPENAKVDEVKAEARKIKDFSSFEVRRSA